MSRSGFGLAFPTGDLPLDSIADERRAILSLRFRRVDPVQHFARHSDEERCVEPLGRSRLLYIGVS